MLSINSRAYATEVLIKIIQDKIYLADALSQTLPQQLSTADRAFIHELCYGVARWYFQIEALLKILLKNPMKEQDQDIFLLLMLGIYQILYTRVPSYAAVSETVNAVHYFKKPWAKALVNGVLRRFLRERDSLIASIKKDSAAFYSHPRWLVKKLKNAWPDRFEAILDANNQRPPFSIRVNQQKISVENYLELLNQQNIEASRAPTTSTGIVLAQAIDVMTLPHFSQGYVSIQDLAAQLAGYLLDPQPGERILDACAAPGGKTTHLLEITPNLSDLVAIDINEERLKKIQQNLTRLNLTARLLQGDATQVDSFWDGKLFDKILLDVPCSATGVIRRHPDIKLLREPNEIALLAKQQYQMLDQLWPLLKPGGVLLYVTCSILPDENSEIIKTFIQDHKSDTVLLPISEQETTLGMDTGFGRQLFPGNSDPAHANSDGFFYARLKKHSI